MRIRFKPPRPGDVKPQPAVGRERRARLDVRSVAPADDLEAAVEVLDERRAAFDPVAAVEIGDAVVMLDRGVVDVAADRRRRRPRVAPPRPAPPRSGPCNSTAFFTLCFAQADKRPVGEAEAAPHAVDLPVEPERHVIGTVAERGEPDAHGAPPCRTGRHAARGSAGRPPSRAPRDRRPSTPPNLSAEEIAQELVVVARDIDDLGALARLAQQLLDDVVMALRPIPARAPEPPAVDQIADEIERLGVIGLEEFEEVLILARPCAEMQIGNEDRRNLVLRISIRTIEHAHR